MLNRPFQPGELLLAVLVLLAEQPTYDHEIVAELDRLLGRRCHPFSEHVYPALQALEAEGLIESEAHGDSVVYRTTPAGSAALADRREVGLVNRAARGERSRRGVKREIVSEPRTVTVLFTDVVGSTSLLNRLGDEAAHELRRRHFALLRHAVRHHTGHEVKSLGDGLMVGFASALSAAECAITMQRAVDSCGDPLALRIGVDVGEPIREDNDLFGAPVILARRLCDAAKGGQIVVSGLVRALIGGRGDHEFDSLGGLALRGYSQPVTASALRWTPAWGPVVSQSPASRTGSNGEGQSSRRTVHWCPSATGVS
jgi:class 3 adenylate cyclase